MTFLTMPLHSKDAEALYVALLEQVSANDSAGLTEKLKTAESVILPLVFRKLTINERAAIWALLTSNDPQLAANLLDHFNNTELISLIEALPIKTTIPLFQHLRSPDRRLLLNHLPAEYQSQLKLSLPSSWKYEEKAALAYSSKTVGGICKSEVLKLDQDATVADLGSALRAEEQTSGQLEWRYVYLHDERGAYLGALKIRDIFLRPYGAKLRDYLDLTVPVIAPDKDLHALKSMLDSKPHSVIPVVNDNGFQIGVVGSTHLNEALYQSSKQQLLEQAGVLGGDEFRAMPMKVRNVRRLAFLLPSVMLSYIAVSIIAAFEPIIEQIAVLAAILPLVANLSGAAGNQAVAVSIRELSTGRLSTKDLLYVVLKEMPIGLVNGLLIGIVLAVLTMITHDQQPLALPLLIGAAYAVSSVLAVIIGGSLPLLLKRFNLDPAMLSSPILTTLTDAIAFFSVLYLTQTFLLSAVV